MHTRRVASFAIGLLVLTAASLIAQVSFEQAMTDLSSADAGLRLRTAQMLKGAGYPEAAVPLSRLIVDPQDQVQLEAIAAELNIFLALFLANTQTLIVVINGNRNGDFCFLLTDGF